MHTLMSELKKDDKDMQGCLSTSILRRKFEKAGKAISMSDLADCKKIKSGGMEQNWTAL